MAQILSVADYCKRALRKIGSYSINDAGERATFARTVGAADTSACDLTTLALTGLSARAGVI